LNGINEFWMTVTHFRPIAHTTKIRFFKSLTFYKWGKLIWSKTRCVRSKEFILYWKDFRVFCSFSNIWPLDLSNSAYFRKKEKKLSIHSQQKFIQQKNSFTSWGFFERNLARPIKIDQLQNFWTLKKLYNFYKIAQPL
jgi:hypothetical protein